MAASAALLLPGMASAAGYIHPANNEAGAVVHPEHFKSSKTRAQVTAEAEAVKTLSGLCDKGLSGQTICKVMF